MDRDRMLHYTSYFSPAELARFHVPDGTSGFSSSAEDERSSESSREKPPRHLNTCEPLPVGNYDVSYGGFSNTKDPSHALFNTEGPDKHRSYHSRSNVPYAASPLPPPSHHSPGTASQMVETDFATQKNVDNHLILKPVQGAVRYWECGKNHAASLGGYALDGCGEFLPHGADGIGSLMCSACGCHRNFHRQEVKGELQCSCVHYRNISNPCIGGISGPPTPGLCAISDSRDIVRKSEMDMAVRPLRCGDGVDVHQKSMSRKRRQRTMISIEQKEKMFLFAQEIEWKIVKQNEIPVQQFCNEIGVERGVFKVWMHNNKHTYRREVYDGEARMHGTNYKGSS